MNLNGRWGFAIDPKDLGERERWWEEPDLDYRISVPFPPESTLSGLGLTDFMPIVWYSRTFRLSNEMVDKRILLHFGAVDYEARAWVNGHPVGEHLGGYVPFTFDITSSVVTGRNCVVLRVRDDNRCGLQPSGKQSPRAGSYGCMYTRTTGIWQTVWLEAVEPTHVEMAWVSSPKSGSRIWAMGSLSGKPAGLLHARVLSDGSLIAEGRSPASVYTKVPIEVEDALHRWGPSEPKLYDLELELREGRDVIDTVTSYFGIRSVEIVKDHILIDGHRIFQRLVLDQGYYREGIYTAPTDADLRRDIEIAKEMGFNGARLHQKVFEPRFLYWADRLGYLVWGEFPSWGIDTSQAMACQNFVSEWVEVVKRDVNHPCIIGWCPFNETPTNQNKRFIQTVYETTKSIDPGRPVIDTSGYTHVVTDIYDCHDYDQDVEAFKARHSRISEGGEPFRNHPEHEVPYSGQPVMVSEYGGIWWNPGQVDEKAWGYGERPRSEEEFLRRYEGLTKALLSNPRMVGFCYTQLYDIEQEVNGLYTYDRRPKFDPALIRAINGARAAYED